MPPEAVLVVLSTCLASASGFAGIGDEHARAGFQFDGQKNEDIRWRHPDGHEAFFSQLNGAQVCSVAYDGDFGSAPNSIGQFISSGGSENVKTQNGRAGREWHFEDGRILRILHKEGDVRRVILAVFEFDEG